MLILEPLGQRPEWLRELVSAGEPLNPEVIKRVRSAWGITIRDGYGQTETTLQVGNMPGLPVKAGRWAVPLPGYRMELLDPDGKEADEGELTVHLEPRPMGLMVNYADDLARTRAVMSEGYYRTGDIASRDAEGYSGSSGAPTTSSRARTTASARSRSRARCSSARRRRGRRRPFAGPDPGSVPKGYVTLAPGFTPDAGTARRIFDDLKGRLAPFRRVRRLEFVPDLPKTVSGKIRRVQLRAQEANRDVKGPFEFTEDDVKPD